MRHTRTERTSPRRRLALALAAFSGALLVTLPANTSAAPIQIDVAGQIVVETFGVSLPNDPNRCVAVSFVEFAPVPGGTTYTAQVMNNVLHQVQTFSGGPTSFPADHYTINVGGILHTFDAPGGKHRIGPLGSYSVGTGCADAFAGASAGVSLVSLTTMVDNQSPTASFTWQENANDPSTIEFDASASSDDKGIASYAWDFGDGGAGSGVRPSHTYAQPGRYSVTLTVTDAEGETGEKTLDIDVATCGSSSAFRAFRLGGAAQQESRFLFVVRNAQGHAVRNVKIEVQEGCSGTTVVSAPTNVEGRVTMVVQHEPDPKFTIEPLPYGHFSPNLVTRGAATDATAEVDFTATDTCFDQPVTLLGTNDPEMLTSQPGDVVVALGGNDTVQPAADGGFVACGNDGLDRMTGSSQKDLLDGGEDKDVIDAAGGPDVIRGGPGDDELAGGMGDDRIDGEQDNDTLIDGGLGDDVLIGGDGTDHILGGTGVGRDNILGGPGHDVLEGGDGCDLIHGGGDDDVIDGGGGPDAPIAGICDGGLYGDDGPDTIAGGFGADEIHGGEAHDEIEGGEGADVVFGDGDCDSVAGGDGADAIDGGLGSDAPAAFGRCNGVGLTGGKGTDTIRGGDGDDRILGEDGADTLDGGPGSDTVYGGDGGDRITGGDEPGEDCGAPVGTSGDELFGDNGADTIDAGAGRDLVEGADDRDTLNGGPGCDILRGQDAADTISGGDGDDLIHGGRGQDTIQGDSAFAGRTGNDRIGGGTENDTIGGGPGNDIVYGGAGTDQLSGGPGNDQLDGGVTGLTNPPPSPDPTDVLVPADEPSFVFGIPAPTPEDDVSGDTGQDTCARLGSDDLAPRPSCDVRAATAPNHLLAPAFLELIGP
jgi:Ca2+-binding RTX toxin-like protein